MVFLTVHQEGLFLPSLLRTRGEGTILLTKRRRPPRAGWWEQQREGRVGAEQWMMMTKVYKTGKAREKGHTSLCGGVVWEECFIAVENCCIFPTSQRKREHSRRWIKIIWWGHWTRGCLEKACRLLVRRNWWLKLTSKPVKSLSRVRLSTIPWTVAHQAPPSMEFSRQEYRSGLPFPSPGDHPDSLWPHGPHSPWNSPGHNTGVGHLSLLQGIFPTQGLHPGLPHCRCILYQLSHQGSPVDINVTLYACQQLECLPDSLMVIYKQAPFLIKYPIEKKKTC